MPGVIMNDSTVRRGGENGSDAAVKNTSGLSDKGQARYHHTNGISSSSDQVSSSTKNAGSDVDPQTAFGSLHSLPPEITHITNGFFPFGRMVNRTVTQCWNDLIAFISELDDGHFRPQDLSSKLAKGNNEAVGGQYNEPSEMIRKKSQLIDFFHTRRAEFIKLLVLSQWGRQSVAVSRLIDLHAFLRMRYDSYNHTLLRVGSMKRDLVRAQMCNPDFQNALKVISVGGIVDKTVLGLPSPKGIISPNKTLKTLHKINKLIRVRLALHDDIPPFASYVIHDGRVTFTVPAHFEVDLSIALESRLSQFFFVDIRFLFSPSSPLPAGRIRDDLDRRINAALMRSGVAGCFSLLHNLTLTQKIIICFRQAVELARYHWRNNLRVELLRRTLIIHYWTNKPLSKSWIEIGIRSGQSHNQTGRSEAKMPFLYIRWICNDEEVLTENIHFDQQSISIESTLRGIIARHISNVFLEVYASLRRNLVYRPGGLYLGLSTSTVEPGDCYVDVQLTNTKHVRVVIEPISGAATLITVPPCINRGHGDLNVDKASTEEISDHVCRLRCIAALEEVELHTRALGWRLITPGNLDISNLRRVFPLSDVRYIVLFQHIGWERGWVIAFTSSMDGDNWWIVQLRGLETPPFSSLTPSLNEPLLLHKAHVVTGHCDKFSGQLRYSSFAELAHALTGMIVVHSNSNYLVENGFHHFPPPHELVLGSDLRVPNKFLRFNSLAVRSDLHINPRLQGGKRPIINETVSLSFRGIDHESHRAIVVAYGFLAVTSKDICTIARNDNFVLAFRPEKGSFAIRFLPRVGQPVVVQLFSCLEKLYNMILALKSLKDKQFDPKLISSNQLSFTYPRTEDLQGCITFHYPEPPVGIYSRMELETSNPHPITRSHMTISFNYGNPHQRITESLTPILNKPFTGLKLILEFLTSTLPLLSALEHICASRHTGYQENSRVQVSVRTSKMYQLVYPNIQYRFHVTMRQRRKRSVWLLYNYSTPRARMDQVELEKELKEKIFDAKGNGWRGVGDGVIAEIENVGDLILFLDTLMRAFMRQEISNSSIRPPGSSSSNKQYSVQHQPHTNPSRGEVDSDSRLTPGAKYSYARPASENEPGPLEQTSGVGIQSVITID